MFTKKRIIQAIKASPYAGALVVAGMILFHQSRNGETADSAYSKSWKHREDTNTPTDIENKDSIYYYTMQKFKENGIHPGGLEPCNLNTDELSKATMASLETYKAVARELCPNLQPQTQHLLRTTLLKDDPSCNDYDLELLNQIYQNLEKVYDLENSGATASEVTAEFLYMAGNLLSKLEGIKHNAYDDVNSKSIAIGLYLEDEYHTTHLLKAARITKSYRSLYNGNASLTDGEIINLFVTSAIGNPYHKNAKIRPYYNILKEEIESFSTQENPISVLDIPPPQRLALFMMTYHSPYLIQSNREALGNFVRTAANPESTEEEMIEAATPIADRYIKYIKSENVAPRLLWVANLITSTREDLDRGYNNPEMTRKAFRSSIKNRSDRKNTIIVHVGEPYKVTAADFVECKSEITYIAPSENKVYKYNPKTKDLTITEGKPTANTKRLGVGL